MRKYLIFSLISALFLSLLFAYHAFRYSDKNLHLTFCDVGQGDAIHIRTPEGDDILIDGGPDEKVLNCLASHMPIWDRQIEAIYMTHPDSDHLTGLISVFKNYKVNYFGTSEVEKSNEGFVELQKAIQKEGLEVDYVLRGDHIKTKSNLKMTTLWPTKEFILASNSETNDHSLVQIIEFGSFRALLTGDVSSIYLNSIMPLLGKIDVIQAPHHGSKTGIDEFTFQHILPKLAIISAGKNNRYGHPSKIVIDILSDLKVSNKNTAAEGDIEIISDGKRWWVR